MQRNPFSAGFLGLAAMALGAQAQDLTEPGNQGPFQRVASFPIFENTSVDNETVAEIVTSALRGTRLVYTDSQLEKVGFIDITDPANPQPAGVVDLPGEPTSVAVRRKFALVCVNTSQDFVNTSGSLEVIDITTQQIVRSIDLGGQPDAIAISPNGRYAAICIENERDEDLGSGEPPQLPAGYLVIVDLVGGPQSWTTRNVDLTGIADVFPEDPEPEFVDINGANFAAITLQENNHIAIVFLPTGQIVADFSCGTVDLTDVDTNENDLIQPEDSLTAVPREPDAVTWISPFTLATADEGDLFGGSRGFTAWSIFGDTLFEAGNTVEHLVTRAGHYPESRSENKGNEPEGIEFGEFGNDRLLFVGSERSSVVAVYGLGANPLTGAQDTQLLQLLPTGVAPEGLHAIPERDLFVVSCEEDSRDDKIRSTVMIYQRTGVSTYPTLLSNNRPGTEVPIPWGALSGLAAGQGDTVYTVHDSYYGASRIFTIDNGSSPARLTAELQLLDDQGVLANALNNLAATLPTSATGDFDVSAIVEGDGSVNLDLEGVAVAGDGGFWVCSEGAGNLVGGVSDPSDRPFESPNLILHVTSGGSIDQAILPPTDVTSNQFRFGFEGLAEADGALYVAFQRAWSNTGDPSGLVRIGRYDLTGGEWTFAHYPLEAPSSPAGGWVGLSDLTYLGGSEFALIERDNQGGPDAAIKLVTTFSIDGVDFLANDQVANFPVLAKTVVLDALAADIYGPAGGLVPEKLEGLAVLADGTALIVNDNDGVDDNSGETLLIEVPAVF
jgi:hypothetical protein